MGIFNFINARKLEDEFNVFDGMDMKSYFTIIVVIIFILQIIILTLGNIAFRCATWGLGIVGWLISFAFGIGGIFVSMLLKLVPEDKCCGGKSDSNKKGANRMNSLSVRRFGQGASYNKNSGKLSNNNSGNSKNLDVAK